MGVRNYFSHGNYKKKSELYQIVSIVDFSALDPATQYICFNCWPKQTALGYENESDTYHKI